MFKNIVISPSKLGVESRLGRVIRVHGPGEYRHWAFSKSEFELVDLNEPEVKLPGVESKLRDTKSALIPHIDVVDIGAMEIGVVYKQDRPVSLLAPGARVLYWKAAQPVRIERMDLRQLEVPEAFFRIALMSAITTPLAQDFNRLAITKLIAPHEVGVLYVDGKFLRLLSPGQYAFWKCGRHVNIDVIDLRSQFSDVAGQEILTKDKLTLRVNLSAHWKVQDAVLAKAAALDFKDALYRQLQFALRLSIGTRTLDELLANKQILDDEVLALSAQKAQNLGLELLSVGVKDIILPGEIRELLNQVVQAEKSAQANVIKRREEIAATRSLLNTAKLLDESPTLLRLKELEALEKVSEKVGNLTVLGGVEGLVKQLVSLKA
jgi:regulator of protease activity HflC (stomatin/prohibitin superfamily)